MGLMSVYVSCFKRLTILSRAEADYKVVEMDSHPARTNGFLTGCLVEIVLNQEHVPIEYFARFDLYSLP